MFIEKGVFGGDGDILGDGFAIGILIGEFECRVGEGMGFS